MQIIGRGKEILVCEGLWAGMWTGDCVTSCTPSQTCNLTEKIVLQGDMCWFFPFIFYTLLYTLLPNAYTHTHSQTHTLSTMSPAASIQRAGVAFTVKKNKVTPLTVVATTLVPVVPSLPNSFCCHGETEGLYELVFNGKDAGRGSAPLLLRTLLRGNKRYVAKRVSTFRAQWGLSRAP